ncbi:methionyl-tRNA formyltransferase [Zhouia amylolytica]|uniref:Methionyl-tRNA formyltransferase n=1 Tax=Zhouia amylolytica TaxID=376730 RepID=A0A1I6TCI4_9FLAO|nr:methionyl-tRNA formyltransferase [Zhouia amylolytica]MCQ0112212.1 methionyl-tRNA formyltransferase [Zhouia amylolytica]SFS86921.1 methionyl-tRNA formyltransferase [Zhouia amylolytica]
MERDLKIVFMGTPDFAVETLKTLVENNYNIVGVITAPDKPAGRGRKLHQSAVKEYAVEQGLHVMQPTNLKSEEFLNELRSLEANLQVVVAFRMLPKAVWQMPAYGTFNLHASLLPQYRGAAPINWAIINGETKTGVTTFFIDEKIDTGAMIFQEEVAIGSEETAGMLHDKLMLTGAQLVLKTVNCIKEDKITTRIQNEDEPLKVAYKIHKETCKIDWEASIDSIYNLIRGLSPYPAAWTTLYNGEEEVFIKIYNATKEIIDHEDKTGTLSLTKNSIKVAVRNGYIILNEVQLPGKRKMNVRDVLNGYEIKSDAYVR